MNEIYWKKTMKRFRKRWIKECQIYIIYVWEIYNLLLSIFVVKKEKKYLEGRKEKERVEERKKERERKREG